MNNKQNQATGQKRKQPQEKNSNFGLYFLSGVFLLYVILYLFDSSRTGQALKISSKILIQVIPVFLLVILFMGLLNYFINKKVISRYLGKSAGIKGWLLSAVAGLLSHGPIYAWYPLLKDLKQQGMKDSLISVFLYNRAIKIPMLPVRNGLLFWNSFCCGSYFLDACRFVYSRQNNRFMQNPLRFSCARSLSPPGYLIRETKAKVEGR